ncbi:hypothetical protein JV173_04775 [Acholeplasma equirhinis]|uniref:hypothetical protein n=1 Tax=Acholeplasma equirhinis TaxID=555393 RepID=UPI00197ABB04|nr:hypothetical protein [Acholeplasma equirhinis]MBN3490825.1 hypothetical protein [Acholeplasma equirhinis]
MKYNFKFIKDYGFEKPMKLKKRMSPSIIFEKTGAPKEKIQVGYHYETHTFYVNIFTPEPKELFIPQNGKDKENLVIAKEAVNAYLNKR